MGLFLRKSFSAGPIRFNLSKSGIGISAGVKGARVGVGPRGAYVAGGRHGLYFKERIGRSHSARNSMDYSGPVEERVDTGVTYPSNIRHTEVKLEPVPSLSKAVSAPVYAFIAFVLSLILMFFIESEGFEVFLFLIVFFSIPYVLVKFLIHTWIKTRNAVVVNVLEQYEEALETGGTLSPFIVREDVKKAGKKRYLYYRWHILERYLLAKLSKGQEIDEGFLEKAIKQMDFPNQYARTLKIRVFKKAFASFIEDEHLDDDEETILRELELKLKLDDTDIEEELQSIEFMSKLRKDAEQGLKTIDVNMKLQRAEKCYFISDGKTIKEKILHSRTIDGVKHKTLGFVEDRIGNVILTSKRLLVVGGGTSTIRLEKIIDIILQFENNIVELIVDGKQKPVYITSPEAPNLSVKIQQAVDALG